jgi:DNA-binding transcriptional LysR family regulator
MMAVLAGALQDLNDLYFFAAVVEHAGFSAAGRALGVPKSRLSKRVAQLEERLGVRLLQRTTRRFVVTEVGERFYTHCRAVLEEAQAAQDAVDELRAEPRGVVRLSCPVSLAQTVLAHILPDLLAQYPKMQVRLLSNDRRVDLIGEGYDLAIRVRTKLDTDANLVIRSFGHSSTKLVASPARARRCADVGVARRARQPGQRGSTGTPDHRRLRGAAGGCASWHGCGTAA